MKCDKKNQALYSVIFDDESHFEGGIDYHHTRWLEIPDKKIKRIFYRLPDGNYLTLHGYDKYYHMIEATKDWVRVGKTVEKLNNEARVEYAYIMGKSRNKVTSYRITLFQTENGRYKIGDIVRREFNIKDKKITGLNPNGWR